MVIKKIWNQTFPFLAIFETELTSITVSGTHHNHRGADASGLSQAQTVVLLLGKHRHLIIGIVYVYDHLRRRRFIFPK